VAAIACLWSPLSVRIDVSRLRESFDGTIVTPFDPVYEGNRVLFNNRSGSVQR